MSAVSLLESGEYSAMIIKATNNHGASTTLRKIARSQHVLGLNLLNPFTAMMSLVNDQ